MNYYIWRIRRWISRLFWKRWFFRLKLSEDIHVRSYELDPEKEVLDLTELNLVRKEKNEEYEKR